MIFTEEDEKAFNSAKFCWICEEEFPDVITERPEADAPLNKGKMKVRDHCHLSGNYRGAAHSFCNLKLREEVYSGYIT